MLPVPPMSPRPPMSHILPIHPALCSPFPPKNARSSAPPLQRVSAGDAGGNLRGRNGQRVCSWRARLCALFHAPVQRLKHVIPLLRATFPRNSSKTSAPSRQRLKERALDFEDCRCIGALLKTRRPRQLKLSYARIVRCIDGRRPIKT